MLPLPPRRCLDPHWPKDVDVRKVMTNMKTNMIDLHCDTFYKIGDPRQKGRLHLRENDLEVDIKKLRKNGSSAQMFAAYTPTETLEEFDFHGTQYEFFQMIYGHMLRELELNKDEIAIARNSKEYFANQANGKISAFLTVEEGSILEGKIERLDEIYNMGFRIFGLIWMPENCNGFCNSKKPELMKLGLKPFGIEVVERANELGMIIDVSHLNDGGFYEVAHYSKKPFAATHSNCRALVDETRNLDDHMIRTLADHGGVMGLNLLGYFLDPSIDSRVEFMVNHIKHIRNVGGIETSAIGTDFDGIEGPLEIDNIGDMDKLFIALSRNGFTDDEIEKIAYKNALRVITEVCG